MNFLQLGGVECRSLGIPWDPYMSRGSAGIPLSPYIPWHAGGCSRMPRSPGMPQDPKVPEGSQGGRFLSAVSKIYCWSLVMGRLLWVVDYESLAVGRWSFVIGCWSLDKSKVTTVRIR